MGHGRKHKCFDSLTHLLLNLLNYSYYPNPHPSSISINVALNRKRPPLLLKRWHGYISRACNIQLYVLMSRNEIKCCYLLLPYKDMFSNYVRKVMKKFDT